MKLGLFLRHLGTPIIYYPKLAQFTGGVAASVLFYQVFDWQSQLSHPQEWVKITSDEIEKATGLNRSEQEIARRQLQERLLLKARLINDTTLELWADIDALENKLDNIFTDRSSDIIARNSGETKNPPVEVVTNYPTSNLTIKTDKNFGENSRRGQYRRPFRFEGPWKSDEELQNFQRTLEEYAKNQGLGFGIPFEWAFKVIDAMTKGLTSPFWEEFKAGIPLGSSQKVKREWEIEPGVPYPAFEEERTQYYVRKGEPLEQAVLKARSDLRNPILGRDLWEGFLRKCDRIADEAIKAKKHGLETPYLPASFTDKPQITKESVIKKLEAISPQFSLFSSSSNMLSAANLEQPEIDEQAFQSADEIPSIASLQEACKTPIGRNMIENLIAKNPDWGYEMVDGQVIESIPF